MKIKAAVLPEDRFITPGLQLLQCLNLKLLEKKS